MIIEIMFIWQIFSKLSSQRCNE